MKFIKQFLQGYGAHVSGQYHAAEVRRSKGLSDSCDKEVTSARDKDLTHSDLTSHSVSSATYRCDVSINSKVHRNSLSRELWKRKISFRQLQ